MKNFTDPLNISIRVPGDVQFILDTLKNAGYEAYIVGGCVRDSILGRIPGDWDITTSALPVQVKSLFSNTADNGIKHGTVMVIRHGLAYEVTTYRIDGEYKDGRHPESVSFTPSLKEDLKRRDFTVNAFAYSPETGVVDLFDGLSDLECGLIRAVGSPEKRFSEDALRIMRAVRFSAQLSFEIEENTWNAVRAIAPKLSLVSAERIRVEFEKTLFSENPSYVNKYRELGLAEYITPDVYEKCFDQESEKIYEGIGTELSGEELKYLRLAAFFKDLTCEECRKVMRQMTFDNKTRDIVSSILRYKDKEICPDGKAVRGALRQMGVQVLRLLLGFKAACGADVSEVCSVLEGVLERGEAWCISMLAVNGSDLMEAGVPQGRELGAALAKLLDAVIDDPSLNEKEKLLKLL